MTIGMIPVSMTVTVQNVSKEKSRNRHCRKPSLIDPFDPPGGAENGVWVDCSAAAWSSPTFRNPKRDRREQEQNDRLDKNTHTHTHTHT